MNTLQAPIPLEAPVTIATLLVNSKFITYPLVFNPFSKKSE